MNRPNLELSSALIAVKRTVSAWNPGDLMGLSEVKGALEALTAHPSFSLLPKTLGKKLADLGSRVMELVDEDLDGPWIRSFQGLKWPPLDEEPETPPAPVEVESEAPTYTEGYFDHVIEDPKLLAQLCDEVKEHLDLAQFSLVDLERDPDNPETVNRVFRSFHTMKSSAAFLGLKNLEETAHALEELLVLLREGKLPVSPELTDVIFQGIGLLRDLSAVIEVSGFQVKAMVEAFRAINIYPYIGLLKKILANYTRKKIGEILQEEGILGPEAVGRILEVQKAEGGKFGEVAVRTQLVKEPEIQAAILRQGAPRKATYVKVLNERLATLVDIVGELVVNQSMLRQYLLNPEASRDAAERSVSQLEIITTDIKNLVLNMGMVQISEIFNKLRVVIRNTASDTGKLVSAEFIGEDTELDRNIIETIYDPLVHLVRNAVDHGLESPADRQAAGKNTVGQLIIGARHRGNGIELSIEDDGGGIDRARVKAKAVKAGLITEAQADGLRDREILDLLFLPGFSTRDVATEISGRGVGLDVVRKNIEQIHGKVDLESTLGEGTKFIIRLPLTLAIIDGFVTVVGGTKYIFPFNLIEEIVVPDGTNVRTMEDGNHFIFTRDRHVPVLVAGEVFGHPGYRDRMKPGLESMVVIVLGFEDHRYGVAVDAVVEKQEIVIKSLNEALGTLSVFSGGTIFGDGEIGFVVDVEEFIQTARKETHEDSHR